MLAATASPVALFALGSFLKGHKLKKHKTVIFAGLVVKLILLPIIAYIALRLTSLQPPYSQIFLLMAGMPTAVTAFVIAEKYSLDRTVVAGAMLATTVLSVVSVQLLSYL